MRGLRSCFSGVVFLLVLMLGTLSWGATISGTVTNNSGKNGWINLTLLNEFGSSGLGTAVFLNSGASTSYSIVGAQDSGLMMPYTLEAYLDTTSTGMRHANDPAASAQVTISNGQNVTQNLTIGAPGVATLSEAPALSIMPTNQGAFIMVDTFNQMDTNGRLIADSYSLSCNSGTISVTIPNGDNPFAILTGLTNGSTLSCTATPVVSGVADNAHAASASSPIGDCNVAGNCAIGTARLTGKIAFGNGVSYLGKPLYIAAQSPDEGQLYVAGIASVSSNPATFDIYGVPAGTYKIYTILDANSSKTIGDADLSTRDGSAPVVTVTGLDATVTTPTITLFNKNSYLEFAVNHSKYGAQNDLDYNFTLQLSSALKRPVKFNVKDVDQTTLLYTIGRSIYGGDEFWSFGPNIPRPTVGATYGYADIIYDDLTTDSNIPLTVKAIPDAFPTVTFPSGDVRLPDNGNPLASWQSPNPLPGYYFSYSGWIGGCNTNGGNPNDFILNSQLSTNFTGCAQQPGAGNGWQLMLRDQFGNRTEQYTSFTHRSSGPVISNFTPSSGGTTQSISVTGSGFTGASSVTISGRTMTFNVVDDAHITINPTSNPGNGPILVTAGGITGASSSSYKGLVKVGGTISDKAGTRIPGAVIKVVDSNPVISATAGSPNGDYILSSVPAIAPFELQISAPNFQPTYSRVITAYGDNTTSYTWNLYTLSDLAGWGVASGKGVIRARVSENQSGGATPSVGDATVTASSWLHPDTPYVVKYADVTTGAPSNSATATPNTGTYMGNFYVMDIDEGDIVTVKAHKAGYEFVANAYQVHGDSVSQGRIYGAKIPTSLNAVTAATPNGDGTYNNSISVSFAWTPNNDATINAGSIYYTTDGLDPRFYPSTSYSLANPSSPPTFNLSSTTTVKYVYRNYAGVFGAVGSTTFVIRKPPSIVSLSTNSGNSGETLNLAGQFPDTNTDNYQVLFNGVTPATNLSIFMGGQLQFTVPPGVYSYFTVKYYDQTVFTGNLLSLTISGGGSVNDTGPQATGFYCSIGSCNRYFDSAMSLVLTPTPSNGNIFQGWTPTCSGGSNCSITMNAPVSKTATFVPDAAKPFKIFGTNFDDNVLQNVYEELFTNAYPPGTIIQGMAGAGPYIQDFTANRNVDVIIKGGYDSGFISNAGTFTTIQPITPPLRIQNGRVVFEGIKVK